MNKESSLLLIKVHRENGGLYSLKSCIDFEYIKGYLDLNNIYASVQEDPLLPTLVDVIDDIVFQDFKTILFYIDDCNFKMSRKLIECIGEIDNNIHILAFGELEQQRKNQLVESGLSLWISENVEETLLNIIRKKFSDNRFDKKTMLMEELPSKQLGKLDDWNKVEKLINKIDAYEKVIEVKASEVYYSCDHKRLILEHSDEYWKELIALIAQNNTLLDIHNISNLPDVKINELLKKMDSIAGKSRLTIHYYQLNERIIPQLVKFNYITIIIDANSLSICTDQLNNFHSFIQLFSIEKLTLEFNVVEQSVPQVKRFMIELNQILPLQRLHLQFNCKEHVRDELLSMFPELYKKELMPFINGFIVSNTGLYPDSVTGFGTKHAYVEQMNDSFEDAFKELMNVNNACVLQTIEISTETKVDSHNSSGFTNYHTLVNNDKIFINNHKELEITFTPLKETVPESKKDIHFTEMNDTVDVDIFIEAVEQFQEKGVISHSNLISSYLVNSCMWSGEQGCQVSKLPRVYIDNAGSVTPCKGCMYSIGDLETGKSQLFKNVSLHLTKQRVQRECSTCIVRDNCSKCSYLPDFLEVDQYCRIRRKYTVLEEFLFASQVIFFLKSFSNLFSDIALEDIVIPNSRFSTLYKGEKHSKPVRFYRSFCLMKYREDYLIYDMINQSIVKVNETMAYILEGIIRHASKSQIIDSLTKQFSFETQEAIDFFDNCEIKFSENNWKYYIA